MNMKIQTKIQSQPNNSFNTLNMVFQFWRQHQKTFLKKKPGGIFIAVKHPTLNEQNDSKKLTLLRNGVIWYKKTFVNIFSEFIFFGEAVFCIFQLCRWTHEEEPYFCKIFY